MTFRQLFPVKHGIELSARAFHTLPNAIATYTGAQRSSKPPHGWPRCNLPVEAGNLGFNSLDTTGKMLRRMNYALEIERQVGREYVVQASYVGTQGPQLARFLDANQPTVSVVDPTKRGSQAPTKRVFPFPPLRRTPRLGPLPATPITRNGHEA